MRRLSKHSHPDKTVTAAAFVLLGRLKNRRLEEFDALRHQALFADFVFFLEVELADGSYVQRPEKPLE